MIEEHVLVINAKIPECQEFMALLFESKMKLEFPFSSAEVVGHFSATDCRNAIHILKTYNLPLKIPKFMVEGETWLINSTTFRFCEFIKPENNMEITKLRLLSKLSTNDVSILILKKLGITAIEVPELMAGVDTLLIDETKEECSAFIRFDSTDFEWSPPRDQFKQTEILSFNEESESTISQFVQRENLLLKIPSSVVKDDIFYFEWNESNTMKPFKKIFDTWKSDFITELNKKNGNSTSLPEVSPRPYVITYKDVEIYHRYYINLLIDNDQRQPFVFFPHEDLMRGEDFVINKTRYSVDTMKLVNIFQLTLSENLKYARLDSADHEMAGPIKTFLEKNKIKIRIPPEMNQQQMLRIDLEDEKIMGFINCVCDIKIPKDMLDGLGKDGIKSVKVIGKGNETETDLNLVLSLLRLYDLSLVKPDSLVGSHIDLEATKDIPEYYNYIWLNQK